MLTLLSERLAKLGKDVGVDEGEMYKLLQVSDKPGKDGSLNSGNAVTDDLKLLIKASPYCNIRAKFMLTPAQAARITGVHVSPTVMFNVSFVKSPVFTD